MYKLEGRNRWWKDRDTSERVRETKRGKLDVSESGTVLWRGKRVMNGHWILQCRLIVEAVTQLAVLTNVVINMVSS